MNTSDNNAAQVAWDQVAAGYNQYVTESHMRLAEQALERARLVDGMRFLDVAAGTGALSIPAARLGADVVATDLSPTMLEELKTRARSEGLAIETLCMDGQSLELEDKSFDVAGSQFGVMLFPDMPQGIREMARVVRRGGRVLMVAFGDPAKIEFLRFLVAAIQTVRPDFAGLPTDPPPLPLQLQNPQRLRDELVNAGLRDVTVETITEALEFRTGRALWDWLISSNPIVDMVLNSQGLSRDDRAAVQRTLETMVRQRAAGKGVARLTNPVHIGIGTK